tara:strand:+ start:148 stop:816 length:669 start_codon:yes stop_codon:yes gene_type:complete
MSDEDIQNEHYDSENENYSEKNSDNTYNNSDNNSDDNYDNETYSNGLDDEYDDDDDDRLVTIKDKSYENLLLLWSCLCQNMQKCFFCLVYFFLKFLRIISNFMKCMYGYFYISTLKQDQFLLDSRLFVDTVNMDVPFIEYLDIKCVDDDDNDFFISDNSKNLIKYIGIKNTTKSYKITLNDLILFANLTKNVKKIYLIHYPWKNDKHFEINEENPYIFQKKD